jgi:hypothetical protein
MKSHVHAKRLIAVEVCSFVPDAQSISGSTIQILVIRFAVLICAWGIIGNARGEAEAWR